MDDLKIDIENWNITHSKPTTEAENMGALF
jgi:hypothetical protein